ncbi:molybdopterin molybdenumtransferase MoeA [Paractinoplanes deccanensis]|uniref:Molybdopterin molybdenumtransferase n=1 Tax=Paractinoplanes deccanensis TaxID=113561 RepID=A0ABQ3XX21_9ACTN|nr:molybdopterin-binding protein [Actinoplanes deccanensis]GID72297.1 molybdopterin molybdenumtransferase MoeA [Actinoplanes deccanensis]
MADIPPDPTDPVQSTAVSATHHSTAWSRAYEIAAGTPRPLPAESVTVERAAGRVLAAPLRAVRSVPAFDTAAMDGYAVTGPGPWTVTAQLLAGAPQPGPMRPGTAIEIATGAVVPEGAEAILPYEDSARDGTLVTGVLGARAHIRRAGDDVRPGDELVPAGRPVNATVAAAAVQAGVERLMAHRAPGVTLLVTGNEVISAGVPGPGQVRDSFTGLVSAIAARAGALPPARRHVSDVAALLESELAAARTEVVVVSGSSSAGAADHLHGVLDRLGAAWHVRGVACRPGHPQALAELPDGRWVVSLPGNPFAGLVAALTLLEPLLHALSGSPPAVLPTVPVRGTTRLMPYGVRIVPVHRGTPWHIAGPVSSAGLHAAARADGLAVLPGSWTDGDPAQILALP